MHGRRIRGEIFFANAWILVEGVTEVLLVHAIAAALERPLDTHGIAVIDFQNGGNPAVYVALAEAIGIPWKMVADGDNGGEKFVRQIRKRGFPDEKLTDNVSRLAEGNGLEDELLAHGHAALVRECLLETLGNEATGLTEEELLSKMKKRKTPYMTELATRVAEDKTLAKQMPSQFVDLVMNFATSRS